ncbi:MAG TPA: bifunctional riboflavin kinase/FAD synthetase [Kofleriaceae bacterium]|nr:bifunctional riboflavin kinase/FAD synthetase [Kofleriaceae bacterium]
MEVFSGHRRLTRAFRAPAVAIGTFDGVHRGHQELVARARAAAARLGGEAVVLTFDPHPASVVAPERAPRLLTTTARKLELLAAAGADAAVVEPFDRELAALAPRAFAETILAGSLGARHLVVGYDFRFGQGRAGGADTLRELGGELGFTVEVVDPVAVDGTVASSSRIRALVEAGELAAARALLGRDPEVEGEVVRGAGRGRGIGVPTANLAIDAGVAPPLGIYAVWVALAGERYAGAASVGTNPTFDDSGRMSLEVHILDFDRDCYRERVRLAFVERLRGELRFAGAAELVEQIRRDIADTRRILAER